MRRGIIRTNRCQRRLGIRLVVGAVIWSFVIIAFCGRAMISPRVDDTKRVLILYSNQSVLPATNIIDTDIRQEIYLLFTLSLRDDEDLLAERGLDVSYETVRRWG
jgi:hypothetical protein